MWPFLPHIPNLHEVSGNIWRGGQPDQKGWMQLQQLGIKTVVKLNTIDEATDLAPGMQIRSFPITVRDQLTGSDLDSMVPAAVAAIQPYTFIHCGSDARTQSEIDQLLGNQGGQDRTGLVCACYRVKCGWSYGEAEKEMLSYGFHKLLFGLWEYWEKLRNSGAIV
jgi:hypothetical protein